MHVYYIKTRPVQYFAVWSYVAYNADISLSPESMFSSTSQSDTHSEKEGEYADDNGRTHNRNPKKKKNTNQHMDWVVRPVFPISDFK